MAVHRRQLPIVGPCEGFDPAPGSQRGEGGFCQRCRHQVHDVSSMRESELHALMTAHAGRRVCLSYRVDARGYIRLRPEPRAMLPPAVLGALALLLAACAGYLPETESPGWACRDPDGYAVECPVWGDRDPDVVPEAIVEAEPAEGCPIRATPEALDEAAPFERPPIGEDRAEGVDGELDGEVTLEPGVDVDPDAVGTSMKYRANFSIDPEGGDRMIIGIVVGWSAQDPRTGRLRYVPTATLLDDWRARRAERKAARERRRMAARR